MSLCAPLTSTSRAGSASRSGSPQLHNKNSTEMVFFPLHALRIPLVLRRILLHHQRMWRQVIIFFQQLQTSQYLLHLQIIVLPLLLSDLVLLIFHHRRTRWLIYFVLRTCSGSYPTRWFQSITWGVRWVPATLLRVRTVPKHVLLNDVRVAQVFTVHKRTAVIAILILRVELLLPIFIPSWSQQVLLVPWWPPFFLCFLFVV